MTAEAVLKIKEAEEKSIETIRIANEKAKDIVQKAIIEGEQKRKAIISEANKKRQEIINSAVKIADESCKPLLDASDKEIGKIKHPDAAKLKAATNIVIERIVNADGYR